MDEEALVAVAALRSRRSTGGRWRVPTDFLGVPRYAWILAGAAIGLALGVLALGIGIVDQHAYRARGAARDVDAIATVLSSQIISHDDGENPDTYTTRVRIQFPAGDRVVTTAIERPGRLHFTSEQELPIVYDTGRPRDADSHDRHNRRANLATAHESVVGGLVLLLLASGTLVVVARQHRHDIRRAMRRSAPTHE